MARYIDAAKLLEDVGDNPSPIYKAFRIVINSQPTADVQEVKHGKWEHKIQEMGIFKHHYIARPCCNDWFNIVNVHLLIGDGKLFDFCPSCGAKMDWSEDE